jgi:hypothetical protein
MTKKPDLLIPNQGEIGGFNEGVVTKELAFVNRLKLGRFALNQKKRFLLGRKNQEVDPTINRNRLIFQMREVGKGKLDSNSSLRHPLLLDEVGDKGLPNPLFRRCFDLFLPKKTKYGHLISGTTTA